MSTTENHVIALRYAHRDTTRRSHFFGPIDRPDESMPISYFVWLIRGSWGAIVVDTGFTAETALKHGRDYVASPAELVTRAGVDPAEVSTVILTHLHYDHAGCTGDFENARVVLQENEMQQWSGRRAWPSVVGSGIPHLVLPEDVAWVADANLRGRVDWVDGDAEIAPGVSVHLVAGHTSGMQVVRVETPVGPVVVASDATHFYENFERRRPYSVLDEVATATEAFDRLEELTTNRELIIPGHDPDVLNRFPPVTEPTLTGHAVVVGQETL